MTINVLYSKTLYSTDANNTNISKHETGEYKHPVIAYVAQNGISKWYANKKSEHFGEAPKIILSWGAGGFRYVDKHGKYGVGGNCWAIIADIDTLHKIDRAFNHPKMLRILDATQQYPNMRYNRNILQTWKKDFYKDFI